MNPPGWYADPQQPGMLRWWDGQAWTTHLRPVEPGPAAPAPASNGGPAADDDPTDAFVGGTFGEVFGAPPGAPAPGASPPVPGGPGGLTGGPPVPGDPFVGPDPQPGTGDPYGGWSSPGPAGAPGVSGAPSGDPFHPFGAPPPAPPTGRSAAVIAVVAIGVLVLLAGVGAVFALRGGSSSSGSATTATTTTTNRNGAPPTTERVSPTTRRGATTEPSSSALDRNAEAAGIPVLDTEGVATHTHTLLKVVFVGADGEEQDVAVEAGIGIDERGGRITAVHTHSDDGVLHVESPRENDVYTIGQFLTLWTGETDPAAMCEALAGEPCTLTATVVAPTSADRRIFQTYGKLPDDPPAEDQGLDTELAQGLVIEIRLDADPSASGTN